MKRFLTYCTVFCLILAAVAIGLECTVRQIPNSYRYKYEWMEQHADSVETLILGSSHAFYGIRPTLLHGKVFNLANASQDLVHDCSLLTYWKNRYQCLRTMIFPISYHTWFTAGLTKENSESYRCRYYKIYMDCPLHKDLSIYSCEIFDMRRAKDKLKARKKLMRDCGCDSLGWGTTYLLSKKDMKQWEDPTNASISIQRHSAKNENEVERNRMMLEEIAQFCQQRGVRLILVTTPCSRPYCERIDSVQYARMQELTRELKDKYQLTYLNYMADERFVDDDFFDFDHLSDVGAEKFTRILARDIQDVR